MPGERRAPKLLAVVINFRTAAMTIKALRALVRELRTLPAARAVVVENASGDGSLEAIGAAIRGEGWEGLVSLSVSDRNRGFAGGINLAVGPALAGPEPPDHVYLLNSDAFVGPGAVRALLEFMERHPQVGICGSYIHGPDGEPHETAFRFPTIVGELIARVPLWPFTPWLRRFAVAMPIPTEAQPVDWLAGASMLIRREVFEAIGLFDEEFFLYYEETDFCRRALRAGLGTWYLPESRVAHVGGGSTGFKDITRPRAWYWFESRRRYLRKHHGRLYLWLANVTWVVGFAAGRLRRRLRRLPDSDPPHLLRDFLRHNLAGGRAINRGLGATRIGDSSSGG